MRKRWIIPLILGTLALGIGFKYLPKFFNGVSQDLRLAISDTLKTFDPAVLFNDDGLIVLSQSLDTLYQYHYLKRPYELIPSLASDAPLIQEQGKKYIIKIRKGVYYHEHPSISSERKVIAQDFITAIKRIAFKGTKSTGRWLFSDKLKGFNEFSEKVGDDWQAMFKHDISGLKAIDDHTLEISLIRPEPNLLNFLAMTFTAPVPKELVLYLRNDLSETILGTAAYEYKGFREDTYFFERFKHFRKEFYPTTGDRYANVQNLLRSSSEKLPFINNVSFKVIKDDIEKWKELENGNLDLVNLPHQYLEKVVNNIENFEKELESNDLELKHFSRMSTRWIGFNMSDPVIGKNYHLRMAIAHALDYDAYIDLISKNTNMKANSIYNPSISGYDPTYQAPYKFDLEKAKEHMRKAGYTENNKPTITYSTRSKREVHLREGEFFKEQLARVGIDLRINPLDFSDFLKLGRGGKLQMWTDNWIYDYPDGENIVQLLISQNTPGINKSVYKNKRVDDLYNQLVHALNRTQRNKIMRQVEYQVNQDIPWVMLMYESIYIAHREDIKNFRKSFFIRNFPKYLKRVRD
jgi:oligopeptide transport system substrate-binding protein